MKMILLSCMLLLLWFSIAMPPASTSEAAMWPGLTKRPPTIIYLVRHAEKATADLNEKDPDLTPAGYARARALKEYLQSVPVAALFASPYKRTRLTLTPLAAGRDIKQYDTHNYAALRDLILKEYTGKTVVVAGHTNSVLEIVQTFGAPKPVPAITETEYDYIFKVTVRPGKKAKVETATYGAPSR